MEIELKHGSDDGLIVFLASVLISSLLIELYLHTDGGKVRVCVCLMYIHGM